MIDAQAILADIDSDAAVESFVAREVEQPLLRLARSPDRDVSASATSQLAALADYRHRQAAETDEQLALARADAADNREKRLDDMLAKLERLTPALLDEIAAEEETEIFKAVLKAMNDADREEFKRRVDRDFFRGESSAIGFYYLYGLSALEDYELRQKQLADRQRLKQKRLADRERDENWNDLIDLTGEIGVDNVIALMAGLDYA